MSCYEIKRPILRIFVQQKQRLNSSLIFTKDENAESWGRFHQHVYMQVLRVHRCYIV